MTFHPRFPPGYDPYRIRAGMPAPFWKGAGVGVAIGFAVTAMWYQPSAETRSQRAWELAHIEACLETPSCLSRAEKMMADASLGVFR